MRTVSYAEIAPNDERIEIVDSTLLEFLLDIPYLLSSKCMPPLQVINEVMRAGVYDVGMSGRREWTPFELDTQEYDQLVKQLLAQENSTFFVDESLHYAQSLEEWTLAMFVKYFEGNDDMLQTVIAIQKNQGYV